MQQAQKTATTTDQIKKLMNKRETSVLWMGLLLGKPTQQIDTLKDGL